MNILETLRAVARVLTPTDPSAFSAEDERRRIGVALVLIAQALDPERQSAPEGGSYFLIPPRAK